MRIGMGMGVTNDGMGMDKGFDGNVKNDMTHCSHLYIHLRKFTYGFVRRHSHQPRAVGVDGENRTCLLTSINDSKKYKNISFRLGVTSYLVRVVTF